MAELALRHQPGVTILCIDTWLASNPALWERKEFRESVLTLRTEKSQYCQFLWNVLQSGLEDHILPFRNTSSVALQLLAGRRVTVDFVYIDAGHLESDIRSDLAGAWQIVKRGGVILGDDFSNQFPSVVREVRRFSKLKETQLTLEGHKWWLRKP